MSWKMQARRDHSCIHIPQPEDIPKCGTNLKTSCKRTIKYEKRAEKIRGINSNYGTADE